MDKIKFHKEYEQMGKIMEDVTTYCNMYEKEVPSSKSVRRWLDGKYTKSKIKAKARTKNSKSQTKYYMDDVAEILRVDHDIDIYEAEDYSNPGGELYESMRFSHDIEEQIKDVGDEYVFMNKHLYDTDMEFRERVDATMNRIKTSMILNLSFKKNVLSSRLYEVDNIRILSSAMQYVNREDDGEFTKAINDEKVMTGDLSFYLKKL